MAGGLTGLAARAALNYMTGTSLDLGAAPQTMELALLTAAPPVDPTVSQLNEVASTGYMRQLAPFAAATTPTPGDPSVIANSDNVFFGPFTDVNGLSYPATHCALIGTGLPADTTNLLDANTSAIETDASGWVPVNNSSVAQSTTYFHSGAASLEVTLTNIGDGHAQAAAFSPATAGTTYMGTVWAYSEVAGAQARIDLVFYDGTGTTISYTSPAFSTLQAATWTPLTWSATAPTGTTQLKPVVRMNATAAAQKFYYDDVSVAESTVEVLMTWQFDAPGQAAQNESLQISVGDLSMSLG